MVDRALPAASRLSGCSVADWRAASRCSSADLCLAQTEFVGKPLHAAGFEGGSYGFRTGLAPSRGLSTGLAHAAPRGAVQTSADPRYQPAEVGTQTRYQTEQNSANVGARTPRRSVGCSTRGSHGMVVE